MASDVCNYLTPQSSRKADTMSHRRRASLDNLLDNERSGTLRRKARIPGVVDGTGLSPLKQLMRLNQKEEDHFETLSRSSTLKRDQSNLEIESDGPYAMDGLYTLRGIPQSDCVPDNVNNDIQERGITDINNAADQASNQPKYKTTSNNNPPGIVTSNRTPTELNTKCTSQDLNGNLDQHCTVFDPLPEPPTSLLQPTEFKSIMPVSERDLSPESPPQAAFLTFVAPTKQVEQSWAREGYDNNIDLGSPSPISTPCKFSTFSNPPPKNDESLNIMHCDTSSNSDTSSISSGSRYSMKCPPPVPIRRDSCKSDVSSRTNRSTVESPTANHSRTPSLARSRPPSTAESNKFPAVVLEKPVVNVSNVKRCGTPSVHGSRPTSTVSNQDAENLRLSGEASERNSITSNIYEDNTQVAYLLQSKSESRCSFLGDSTGTLTEPLGCNLSDPDMLQQMAKNKTLEEIYALPEPQCYSDNTLKAVKKITEKYDTLQRRKLRALSFRENGKGNDVTSAPTSPVRHDNLLGATLRSPVENLMKISQSYDDVFSESSYDTGPPFTFRTSPTASTRSVASTDTGVNVGDIARLDLFYRSRGTDVTVCQCLADLSMGDAEPGTDDVTKWEPVCKTGVPVLVLNTGVYRRKRELHITLAERETGFSLWSDRITYLSNYRVLSSDRQVLQLSDNLRRMVSLRFHSRKAASAFMDSFRAITADANDDLWRIGDTSKPVKKKRFFSFRLKKSARNLIGKKDISKPCNFSHVTNLDQEELFSNQFDSNQ